MEPSDSALRTIVAHLSHLRARYGEVMADPDLVEPTGEYFPDAFALEPEAIQRLLDRMMTYVPVSSDLDVKVAFVEPEAESTASGGCGSGACGPGGGVKELATTAGAFETDDGYVVALNVAEVGDPVILTAAMARALGRIVLFEADEDVDPRDEGALAELTAIACGLGVLLLNGASVYKKGCGGMKRHQATFLSVDETALAVALFVRACGKKPGAVRKHLEVTQREAFDEAIAWLDDQPKLVRALAEHPETLEDGVFVLEPKKGLLGRLLARKNDEDELSLDVAPRSASSRPRSEEERRRIAETKRLVEEALQDT